MPIRWNISPAEQMVIATAEGEVNLSDIEAYLDAVVVADASYYRKLFDASDATFRLSDEEMMLLGARIRAYGGAFQAGPLALVARKPDVIGYLRRFVNLADINRPAEIFEWIDHAREWLASLKK